MRAILAERFICEQSVKEPRTIRERLISRWLPFWKTLTSDEKIIYYTAFRLGGIYPMSFEEELTYGAVQHRNGEYMRANLSQGDRSYLEKHTSTQWHLDLIAELSIRSSDGQVDPFWQYRGYVEGTPEAESAKQLVLRVSADLLHSVQADPARLWQISDHEFEQLVAEIFAKEGYQVELTKRTRDNGYDIIAIQNSLIQQRLLIECKRKRNPAAKVPVSIVREALGALDLAPVEADKVVLVSTNYFTRDAHEAISRNNVWRIALRDYDDIMQWLGTAPRLP